MSASDVQIGGDHYKNMAIQPLEFIMANRLPFPEGAIIQYVCRYRHRIPLRLPEIRCQLAVEPDQLLEVEHCLDFEAT